MIWQSIVIGMDKQKNQKSFALHWIASVMIIIWEVSGAWIAWLIPHLCYDLSLELRLHLGKDLGVRKGRYQLVKHKEYKGISTLYIYSNYEETVQCTWENWVIQHEDEARIKCLLHKVLTETIAVQLIVSSLPLTPVLIVSRRHWS